MKRLFKFIFGASNLNDLFFEISWLLFRLHVGLSIAIGAGLPKVFHKINESGDLSWKNLGVGVPGWFIKQVGEIGFRIPNPSFWAYLAVYGEFIGGLLIAVGLLTRISAIQLAFQFFVVSFIWYKDPAPIVGMYFQQLIFWAFVIVAAKGGGKFSLDHLFWLRKKKEV